MDVKIVDCFENFILLEYENLKKIQRKLLPRSIYNTSIKGVSVDIPDYQLDYAIDYSDVDLVFLLGDLISTIRTVELQDRLRRAGLWKREDYLNYPDKVTHICKQLNVDAPTILNAAQYEFKEKGD